MRRDGKPSRAEKLAVAAVLWVVLVAVVAKPVQDRVGRECGAVDPDRLEWSRYRTAECEDQNGDKATGTAVLWTAATGLLSLSGLEHQVSGKAGLVRQ